MLIDFGSVQNLVFYGLGLLALFVIGYVLGLIQSRGWEEIRRRGSLNFQRSVVKGKISEQVATLLPHFPQDLRASEGKFLGDPIDFVFFKGKDDQNITEVVFLEVKTGRSQLNSVEKQLREVIEQKKVSWHEYRVPEEITRMD